MDLLTKSLRRSNMVSILKKKENIVDSVTVREVDSAEVYLVSWIARYGEFSGSRKRVAKAFLNKSDAEDFVETLERAAKLLQYTEYLDIKIDKQD